MTENNTHPGIIEMDAQFYKRVYEQVEKVPAGKVATYGKIAELAGYPNASREVGLAMSRVSSGSNLPCHRIVNKKGTMAPANVFGGQEQQRKLLQAEGITFLNDDCIDMRKHQWPDESPVEQLSMFDLL